MSARRIPLCPSVSHQHRRLLYNLCLSVGIPFDLTCYHLCAQRLLLMPPRKKQRTDADAPTAAAVPRRTTRSATKAMQASGAIAQAAIEETSNNVEARATTPVAIDSDNSKRILSEGLLQAPNTPGIPERPPFMSEAAFLHLLYASECWVSRLRSLRFRTEY